MNKFSKLILGVAALSLAACSNDEPKADNGGGETPAAGDVAYLNIRIQSADDATSKAPDGTDYLYGDGTENAVTNAYFYFYDAAGNYVLTANRWTSGKPGTTDNVEYIGDNTVVLENLTGKNYPVWMVTVLNQPADVSYAGLSLDELQKEMRSSWNSAIKDFPHIMVTSSYFGDDNKDAQKDGTWRYFATKLNANNFYQQTPDKVDFVDADRVQVYVERLAARVGVEIAIANNSATGNTTITDGYTDPETGKKYNLYRVDASVSGNPNPDAGDAAATKLYVAITGWDLFATANNTNLVKSLEGWNATSTIGGTWNTSVSHWNHPDNHRSYWGKSWTYGKKDAELDGCLDNTQYWEKLTAEAGTGRFLGDRRYCNETTNEFGNISTSGGAVIPSKTTSVLLRAVVCDENGVAQDMVEYLGLNFTNPAFIAKALQNANAQYYTRKVVGEWPDKTPKYEYTQVGKDDVEIVSNATEQGTGAVKLAVTGAEGSYFTISAAPVKKEVTYTNDAGETLTYTWEEYEANPASNAAVNAALKAATNGTSNKAVGRKGGASYYPVPVAHLNAAGEGSYGVVRNHVYNIKITKIKTLGEGVFVPKTVGTDPAEEIKDIPQKEPTYYVESAINILSWKVVSQETEI